MRWPAPVGSSPTRWAAAEGCRTSGTARSTRRCPRQAASRTDCGRRRRLRHRCRAGAVRLSRLAARLEARDAMVQAACGLDVAELFVALDRAAPRRLRILDPAEAPQRVGAGAERVGALSRLVRWQQLNGRVDQAQDLFEGSDVQRVFRRVAEECRGAELVRPAPCLVTV